MRDGREQERAREKERVSSYTAESVCIHSRRVERARARVRTREIESERERKREGERKREREKESIHSRWRRAWMTLERRQRHLVQGSGFRVQGSGLRAQGSGFRVQGPGSRVQGPGFRVQGSGAGGSGVPTGKGSMTLVEIETPGALYVSTKAPATPSMFGQSVSMFSLSA